MNGLTVIKIVFIGVLLYANWQQYFSQDHWIFMSFVNLIFHEAGHVLFMPFGNFLYALGGTLLEIAVPLLCAGAFYVKRDWYAVGFALWWCSTALFDVAVYVADARARALPLITGDPDTHDWFYLLSTLDLLVYDQVFANALTFLSLVVLVGAAFFFVFDVKTSLRRNLY